MKDTNKFSISKEEEQHLAAVMAKALEEAFIAVGCDLRCFDWLSYNPDLYISRSLRENH